MQITIIAAGSRGDVQPYVALGKGLKRAGHTVRVLASQDFHDLAITHGLEFTAMGGNVEAEAQNHVKELVEQGNLLKMLAATGRGAQQLAYQAAISGLAACQESDLLIGGLGGLSVGVALAEKLGITFLQAYLMPFTPTREFPSVLAPLPQTPWTAWANRLSHRLTQQMMWQTLRTADNKARDQVLHIDRASFWGPFAALQRQAQPILYGYSPQVMARPKDWDASIRVTGYWFLEPPAEWEPPAGLVNFLQAGPTPIYIGFGSMPSRNPEETTNLILQALARTGQRAVISAGWGGLKKEHLPKFVFAIGSIPHSWLFPQMAAVVHHGGAGTTAAGLAAGIPSIITPFFGDQPFWGRRVAALGAGPKPIARRRLTVDNLAEAIVRAISDTAMRMTASELGERIRAEDGIARAVEIVEHSRGNK